MSTQINPRKVTDGLLVDFDATKSLPNYNTNLISASEDFTNASFWTMANGTIRSNVIVAPNGTLTGTLLTQTGATTAYLNFGNINITIGTTYTFSAYVKSASQTSIYILLYNTQFGAGVSNVYSLFNLATGTASAVEGGPISQTITSVGDGWFRISLTATANATTSLNAQFLRFVDPGVTSTIYCWGAKIEVGTIATEYFPQTSNKTPSTWTDINITELTPNLTSVEALVVAGGGAGGAGGGAGGGGGVIYNPVVSITLGTSYTVIVGAGGTVGANGDIAGANGSNSSALGLTAIGGGGGGALSGVPSNGGSGGGGNRSNLAGGRGTAGQGYAGGTGAQNSGLVWTVGGGGGGAGGVGQAGNSKGIDLPGDGGIGLPFSISGTLQYYGGGGGGGTQAGSQNGGRGGLGGGGDGAQGAFPAEGGNGTPNTGGGGGSANEGGSVYGRSGGGGSGVVIIRYPLPVRATGGTITRVGNDVVHTFSSGTSSFVVPTSARTFTNNPTYSNLDSGFLTFNGSSQSISIPASSLNTPYTGKTVIATARMNINFGTGFKGLVGGGGGTRNFNTYIQSDATGYRIHFSYGPNFTWVGGFSNYLPTLALGQWFTVAVTQDTAGNVNCYFNGVNVGTIPGITFYQYIESSDIDYIGRTDGFWHGDIAQAKIYSRALTAAEILQNYQSIQSRFSAGGQLARYDGSSLLGWATLGVTVNGGIGNAAPSFYVNAGQYGYIAPTTITSFSNTTITFSVNITSTASLCNLFFAANASGMGTMLRLEGRAGFPSGFMAPTGWNSWDSGPSSGPTLVASVWYNIKIQITPAGLATWYLNGVLQASTASVRLLGNHIGIHGDGVGIGAYFDNITVYSGIV